MRITRDSLLKIAHETATARFSQGRKLVCIYLTGSLVRGEPLLGGTTDIDLVFVHFDPVEVSREISRVSDEVTIDIAHHPQDIYHQPKHLRADAWVGSSLCNQSLQMNDLRHWFEFTQASVAAQFNRPETVLERSRPMAEQARRIWMNLHDDHDTMPPERVADFLRALERSANAIALLSGSPLTERRFLLQFPEKAALLGRPGLSAGLTDLLTPEAVGGDAWQVWMPAWGEALAQAARLPDCPPRLAACRHSYYVDAAAALREDHPDAAVWIALRTWTAAAALPGQPPAVVEAWEGACRTLGLDAGRVGGRLKALDAYLDSVEETLETWAKQNGV